MSSMSESQKERIRQAEKIAEQPEEYKVCEGCGSIVTERTTSCPSCHAYSFDASKERVTAQAQLLASRAASSVLSSDLN